MTQKSYVISRTSTYHIGKSEKQKLSDIALIGAVISSLSSPPILFFFTGREQHVMSPLVSEERLPLPRAQTPPHTLNTAPYTTTIRGKTGWVSSKTLHVLSKKETRRYESMRERSTEGSASRTRALELHFLDNSGDATLIVKQPVYTAAANAAKPS